MQFLVIFLAVPILAVSASLTARDLVQFGTARAKCGNEFTVDPAQIERAQAGEVVQDPEFHCYMACILEGVHLMNPDGSLNANAAIEKVPDAPFHDTLVTAIQSCANENGENKCDTARRLFECLHQQGLPGMLKSDF